MGPCCATCRYSKNWSEELLVCRRLPPVPLTYVYNTGRDSRETVWPKVGPNEWCGEHAARSAEAA